MKVNPKLMILDDKSAKLTSKWSNNMSLRLLFHVESISGSYEWFWGRNVNF